MWYSEPGSSRFLPGFKITLECNLQTLPSMNIEITPGERIPFTVNERESDTHSTKGSSVAVFSSDPASVAVLNEPARHGKADELGDRKDVTFSSHGTGFFVGGTKLQNNVKVTATIRYLNGDVRSITRSFDVVAQHTAGLAAANSGLSGPGPVWFIGDPAVAHANADSRAGTLDLNRASFYPADDRYPDVGEVGAVRRSAHE